MRALEIGGELRHVRERTSDTEARRRVLARQHAQFQTLRAALLTPYVGRTDPEQLTNAMHNFIKHSLLFISSNNLIDSSK